MCENVMDLFHSQNMVKVCAPMVRYSKLPFRSLVRKYDCDLCFTPMIVADSFIKSSFARNSEFSTNSGDKPLIVQFAANNVDDFVSAAEIVAPCSNGVDLNCGCPQRWAMKERYGAYLLTKPELIRDIVLQVRNRIPLPYSVSIKIRILENLRYSVELCRAVESAGVSFITVHARTPAERHQPVNESALKLLRENVNVPMIANGDVKNLCGAKRLYEMTGCQGIMAARGLLSNPALFAGHPFTPIDCVKHWLAISMCTEAPFQIFHHHLTFMLEKILPKKKREYLNSLKTTESVLNFVEDYYGILINNIGVNIEKVEYVDSGDCTSYVKRRKNAPEVCYEDFLENSYIYMT